MYVGWRGEQHAAYTAQITGRRACRQDRVDWPPGGTSILRSTAAACMRTGRGGAHAQIDDVRRVRAAELPRGVRLVTSYLHAATARSLSRCRSPRLRQRLDQRAPLRLVGRTDVGANPRARRVESAHPAYPPGTSIAVLG